MVEMLRLLLKELTLLQTYHYVPQSYETTKTVINNKEYAFF